MRVAVIITARPSYARIQTAIAALVRRGVDVQLIVCASALLERYGAVVHIIRKDFPDVPITEVWSTYEGATLLTSAKETGALLMELAAVLSRLSCDAVLVCCDRHEVLAAAQAAGYLHLQLCHVQGGERSGSIDNKVRDSITQLSDVHLVATSRAKGRIYGLTGAWDRIHVTGCPSVDLAKQALGDPPVTLAELGGAGVPMNMGRPWAVVLFHPVTNEVDVAAAQMEMVLGCQREQRPLLVLWPGQDAGAEAMSKIIRGHQGAVHTVRNLPPQRFLKLLTQASCVIGNSSVGIRECSYLGVPVVNIGSRQQGRERGPNVVDVGFNGADILRAVDAQMAHGPYPRSTLYGHGDAGERMAEVLVGRPV